MCGIFGILANPNSEMTVNKLKSISTDLLKYSESRGKEATGISLKCGSLIKTLKSPHPAKNFIRSEEYHNLFKNLESEKCQNNKKPTLIIGHSRLVTNGTHKNDKNNQPIESNDLVCIHNGIIVNHADLWVNIPEQKKESELDTEVFVKVVNSFISKKYPFLESTKKGLSLIEGAASIALFQKNKDTPGLILATNTGSLYYLKSTILGMLIFSSEERFLKELLKRKYFSQEQRSTFTLTHLKAGNGIEINDSSLKENLFSFPLSSFNKIKNSIDSPVIFSPGHIPPFSSCSPHDGLKRCTKCILPETMPFIVFNHEGLCNYCLNYQKYICKPTKQLEDILKSYRKNDGKPDCLVAFSGGRDSSYGLHLIKNELKLNPLVMTYDWGVVTDLARRNQARMCGTLGVEHILVSANIEKNRLNIKKNLEAWLNRSELGMLPLLMAGDKMFFYYSNNLAKINNIKLIVFCVNPLEKTEFKSGFSGVNQSGNVIFNQISIYQNFILLWYYLKNFLLEPRYLNSSLFDTASAYFVSYFMKHPYIQLFDYYKWDETEINHTLIKSYNWEVDPTTTTTWRIGDGTAAFYNYIYKHVVGFTEHDTFRSNQIREGIITRDQALQLTELENRPRYDAIKDYLSLVGVDFESVMRRIDSLPKFY